MKNIFKRLSKLLQKARQNRVDILNELMKVTQGREGREIVLTLVWPWGLREKLKIAPRGICLWNDSKYEWNRWIDIDFSHEKEENIRKLANNSKDACDIILRTLAGEVKIEVI